MTQDAYNYKEFYGKTFEAKMEQELLAWAEKQNPGLFRVPFVYQNKTVVEAKFWSKRDLSGDKVRARFHIVYDNEITLDDFFFGLSRKKLKTFLQGAKDNSELHEFPVVLLKGKNIPEVLVVIFSHSSEDHFGFPCMRLQLPDDGDWIHIVHWKHFQHTACNF